MTGIHGLQHIESLTGADFAHDDAIRPHAQGVAHQIALRDFATSLDIGRSRLKAADMGLLHLQFG